MPLFVLFVFGAVILGAGVMLSPAYPTQQPRIALAATFALAIIIGGTVFLSSLFGWQTLTVDYLLFVLVVGIFLGGTLSYGQARAEKLGAELDDSQQGWPGPQDLATLGLMGLIFIAPVFILPVALGNSAQGYGFMALTTRQGETFNTFAPFYPHVEYLYAPGLSALTAYLSQQLNQSLHTVQFSVSAIVAFLNVWLAYDFGGELQDKRLGRAMALAMFFSLGVFGALVQGHYTALLGLLFTQAFFIFAIRYTRYGYPVDILTGGLMLGAIVISHPGMTIVAGLGFVPWLATIWMSDSRPTPRQWSALAFGLPLIALLAISPWLIDNLDLLRNGFESPYMRSVDHLRVMLTNHGVWIAPVAILGAWLGWQRRDPVAILAVGWLLLIIDFSTSGGIATLFPFVTRYAYPLDIAQHGPIIPYAILGGMGLLWLWDSLILPRTGRMTYGQVYIVTGILGLVTLAGIAFSGATRSIAEAVWNPPSALASSADINAMQWLKDNTDLDGTRILNFPADNEGGWVPVIAERNSVYYPLLPYARTDADSITEQATLLAFWSDPADAANADLLGAADIGYVIVPQIIGARGSLDEAWRFETPAVWSFPMRSQISDAAYLEQVFEQDGAAVYRVRGDNGGGE